MRPYLPQVLHCFPACVSFFPFGRTCLCPYSFLYLFTFVVLSFGPFSFSHHLSSNFANFARALVCLFLFLSESLFHLCLLFPFSLWPPTPQCPSVVVIHHHPPCLPSLSTQIGILAAASTDSCSPSIALCNPLFCCIYPKASECLKMLCCSWFLRRHYD